MITYSTEVSLFKSTATLSRKEILSIVEAVQGAEEFASFFRLEGYAADYNVPLNGLDRVKALIIDAKPAGGVDNVDLLVTVTNEVPTPKIGQPTVPVGPQSFRCGSRLILLDTTITGLTISNLSPVGCEIQIFGLGE